MQTKTARQLLTLSRSGYGTRQTQYDCEALLDHRPIAHINDVPAGWSVRIYCIPYGQSGAHEVYETYEQARAAVELWVSGLDIDPGE